MPAEINALYRLQLQPEFGFDDAVGITGYLSELGVSDLYCSPYLQAAPGSTHGYDVVNHAKVNTELGGEAGLARLNQALEEQGLGQVADVVPNHMAITGPENPWWWDILKNGPSSPYASYFDIHWDPPETRYKNVVLVPVLGDHYGRVLEAGELKLAFQDGAFLILYYDDRYPVDPRTAGAILAQAARTSSSDTLGFLARSYAGLPLASVEDRSLALQRQRDETVLRRLLADLTQARPDLGKAIETVVQDINQSPDALDQLLNRQNYRLAFWRIARQELGYRRFFDINTLLGLRVEDEEVYRDTHDRILEWVGKGWIRGLRIDHPDGMRNPYEYFQRLRRDAPEAWIVAEKILEGDERLPASWPIQGTTGYDFLNHANGLFVDPDGEQPLTRLYHEFSGETTDYEALVREKKLLVMQHVLGSDLNRLEELFLQVSERHRRYRDYTRGELRAVIQATAASFPVYRTYVRSEEQQVEERDAGYIREAVAEARRHRQDLDPELFDFFQELLLLKIKGPVEGELVMRFQQFTGPVMAKGVEDTAFYCFNRLISLNEVGGDPGRFGHSVEDFHAYCARIQKDRPCTLNTLSTHDTKRSADVRARLNLLSEIPDRWGAAVGRWEQNNAAHRSKEGPDRNDEYFLYQTLVGAWPISQDRLLEYMRKALRESMRHSSWRNPNEAYEEAVFDFTRAILADQAFTADLQEFVDQLVYPGRVNALAQTLLLLTAPGVPDIYQGSELWELSLADPDNRRPVDFVARKRLLSALKDDTAPEAVLDRMEEGLPKLWLVRQALALRNRKPEWFSDRADYRPLTVHGSHRAVAYQRGEGAVIVVPRLVMQADGDLEQAEVELPAGKWRNLLTHERLEGGRIPVQRLLARFPVGLLVLEGKPA